MFPQKLSPDQPDPYIPSHPSGETIPTGVDKLLYSTKLSFPSLTEPNNKPLKSSISANSHQDPSVPSVPDTPLPPASLKESQTRLKALVSAVLKVLTRDQVIIVVMAPHSVHWVTMHQQKLLSNRADSVDSITLALNPMLGGPNSELVAEHLVKASSCAQMGVPIQHTIELHASERSYKADLDCYFGEPNLQAIVALLTPIHDNSFSGYEKAQLSCIRYHISIESENAIASAYPAIPSHSLPSASAPSAFGPQHIQREVAIRAAPVTANHTAPNHGLRYSSLENEGLNDFIPSMAYKELDYFYSLLPGNGQPEPSNEVDISRSESVQEHEQRAVDPDTLDPHLRMRMLQQSSLMPVLPREPRKFAEVQQEIFDARLLALQRVSNTTNKRSDVKCLECGTENSPEWRKGPLGPKTLCNRCGLRYAKRLRGQK